MKDIILAIIASGAFTALVTSLLQYFIAKQNQNADINKGVRDGVKAMLQMTIRQHTQTALKQGFITLDEKKFIHEGIEAAHALGANGEMTLCGEEIDKLPVHINPMFEKEGNKNDR